MAVTRENLRKRPYLVGNFIAPGAVQAARPAAAVPPPALPAVVTRYRTLHTIYPSNLVRNTLAIAQPTPTDARYRLSGTAAAGGDVIYLKYFDEEISSVRLPCPAPAGVSLFVT